VGKGRLGAEEMQRRAVEPEDDLSREKALATVVAGQQAENLLDFDADEPAPDSNRDGLTEGMISPQAIASAAKSTNPLDELMDLFSSASMTAPSQPPAGIPASMGGGMADLMSPTNGSGLMASAPSASLRKAVPAQAQAEDDLLGLF